MIIGSRSATRRRRAAGGYAGGVFVSGVATDVAIMAAIGPTNVKEVGRVLHVAPQGTRTAQAVKIATEDELRVGDDTLQTEPDQVILGTQTFVVMEVKHVAAPAPLPHYEALAWERDP